VPRPGSSVSVGSEILEVDSLAFETSTGSARRAVVDGATRNVATGFVYAAHDVSEDLLDTAYRMLREFFELDTEMKQQFNVPGVRANGLHRSLGRDGGVKRPT
jgi:isopenicillin N synthase-like dioxygenase